MRRLAALVVLAACGQATVAPPPASSFQPPPVPLTDTCGAAPHAALVGQPATALERVLIMRPIRLLRGTQAAVPTADASRINFVIDGTEHITAITCG